MMSRRRFALAWFAACVSCAPSDLGNHDEQQPESPYAFAPSESGVQARNTAQGFTVHIDAQAVRVSSNDGGAAWWADLRIAALGRPGHLELAPAGGNVEIAKTRATLRRGAGIDEWYEHGVRGLEQGFVLREPPTGCGELIVSIAIDGLVPHQDGQRVRLTSDGGATQLFYGGLHAFDAGGRALRSWIDVTGQNVALHIDDAGSSYPVVIDPLVWSQEDVLVASDATAGEHFGGAVALDGHSAVVGAYDFLGSPSPTGAYAFAKTGGRWLEQAKLVPNDPVSSDDFGKAVAVSGDVAVVGARLRSDMGIDSGAAYVFLRSGASWSQMQKLVAPDAGPDEFFGVAVAIDGDTLLVGADGKDEPELDSGAVFVFVRDGDTWVEQQKLVPPTPIEYDYFGSDVALDGDTAVVGARLDDEAVSNGGAAYVFVRSGTSWSLQQTLLATAPQTEGAFGFSVAVAGDTVLVGAPYTSIIALEAGEAYVFRRSGNLWSVEDHLVPPTAGEFDVFGWDVALSGNVAVVGEWADRDIAWFGGVAHVYVRSGTQWAHQQALTSIPPEDENWFGTAVAVSGATVLVGADGDDDAGQEAGTAAVYALVSTPCMNPSDCTDGFCADGFCCSEPCDAACDRCDAPGMEGLCVPRPDGDAGVPACAQYLCDGASASCPESCAEDGDCAAGHRCEGSLCIPKSDNGEDCVDGAECMSGWCVGGLCCDTECSGACDVCSVQRGTCTIKDCGPYRCSPEGTCRTACTSTGDCADGSVCHSDGRCAPRDPPAADGCGCRFVVSASSVTPWLLWLALGAALGRRRFRRSVAIVVVLLHVGDAEAQTEGDVPPVEAPAPVDPPPEDVPVQPAPDAKLVEAKRLFAEGNALRKGGDKRGALRLYQASRRLVPSVANTLNAAICLAELGRPIEALELYEELVARFVGELSAAERRHIGPEISRLKEKVGAIEVLANVDGTLVVDGRARAELPLLSPIRLMPGARDVRIVKEGYEAFVTLVEVRAGATVRVHATLQRLAATGRLRVTARELDGAEVYLDGAPVGRMVRATEAAKPEWEGTVSPGEHYYQVVRGTMGSAPARVVITLGATEEVGAELTPLGPEVLVVVEPASAVLSIGRVPVGRGRWRGRLPVGRYAIAAREDGFLSQRTEVAVDIDAARPRRIVLELPVDEQHPRWSVVPSGHFWLEASLSFAAAPTLASGAESSCDAVDCTRDPAALGVAAAARFGYELPFKLSFELAGGYLRLTKDVQRSVPDSFLANDGATVSTQYELTDALQLDAGFAAGGIGYRLPFAGSFEARAHVLLGAAFVRSAESVTGAASAGGRAASVEVAGTSADDAPNFVLLPELQLGVRFGGFGASVGLAALVMVLEGSSNGLGDLSVQGRCDPTIDPRAIECAPGERLVADQPAHGTFVALMPGITAGYMF